MTRIGSDVKFHDGATLLADDPFSTLAAVRELGFEGILVRTVDEAFPTLDAGAVREFAQEARRHGMFVQLGLGKVNPYMTAELPRVRDLGDGSYLDGMVRMIELCAEHGWTEAWTATGGFKHDLPAPFCVDRFRTDVDWSDQLVAIARFLRLLAPALRANGVRLNLETHEEITTFEILRLIDEIGADVVGVCLDPGNLMVRGEPVMDAVRRVAPFTHMTHLRDAVLVRSEEGIARFLAPIGAGVTDWDELVGILLAAQPEIDLAIEGIGGSRAEMTLDPRDAFWRSMHPDMTESDVTELERLVDLYPAQADRGTVECVDVLRARPPAREDYIDFLQRSRDALRAAIAARQPSLLEYSK
ncbi:sugar phosphate isomerase/epimerase family protein [Microbacterium rhizosphaerae]|uniref:Sugar phosphate isomerase/epimerase family protein n=1 Tax=Microbacterium rhizosphaerae TaxID=1678237 RepID=A0ABZ0SMW2_9MICO|nr:sugar phosphate isomerase/epimerase family protein [Microbacterium rhizosphaerae]WPR90717.1 sugar phosphate isomerase/epimerase family protein [Microbacterium rhizosphaerae]